MSIFKQTIALLVICCLTGITSGAAAYTDIPKGGIDEAVVFLNDLGIAEGYEDGSFKPDMGINRADFAIMFAKLLGYSGEEYTVQHFADVSVDSNAFLYIEYLYDKGIKIEAENGARTFLPDSAITYSDATKMLVSALGYEKYIEMYEANGNKDPYGVIATKIGLHKGAGGKITRGAACRLLFNFVKAPTVAIGVDDGSANYYIDDSKSFLSEQLGLEVREGLFIADDSSALYGESTDDADSVVIDYEKYSIKVGGKSDLVGHKVRYYVDENDTIYSMYDLADETIVLNGGDIQSKSNISNISWEDKATGKYKNMAVASDAFYVYNGFLHTGITDSDLIDINGKIILIDNDGNKKIDVIIIWNYETYVLDSYTSVTDKIYFKNTDEAMSLSEVDCIFIKGNERIQPAELKQWDVLSVAISKDNKNCKIDVSDKKVSGSITALNYNDENIKLNDTVYNADPAILKKVNIGKYYDVYFDIFDRAVYATETSPLKYGYMCGAYIDEETDEDYIVKIFNTDGEFVKYYLNKKVEVTIDGKTEKYKAEYVFKNILKSDNKVNKQVIKYELNADNLIKAMAFATFKLPKYEYEDFSKRWEEWGSNTFVCNMDSEALKTYGFISSNRSVIENAYFQYRQGSGDNIEKQFAARVDSNTQVFVITKEEEGWMAKKATDFGAGGTFNNTIIYDINEEGCISCFVTFQDNIEFSDVYGSDDPFICIGDKFTGIDDNDRIVFTIDGLSNTDGMTKYFVSDETLVSNSAYSFNNGMRFADLECGDIIQAKVDNYGEISAFRLVHKVNENIEFAVKGFGDWGSIPPVSHENMFFGPVRVKNGSKLIYKNSDSIIRKANDGAYAYPVLSTKHITDLKGFAYGHTAIGVFNTKSGKLTQITDSEAFSCDAMFAYTYPGKGGCFIILYN